MSSAKNDVSLNPIPVCESVAQLSAVLHVTRFSKSLYRYSGIECIVGCLTRADVCCNADVSEILI